MITQGLIDFFSVWLAGLIAFVPPLPPEAAQVVASIAEAGTTIGSVAGKLGPIVPFAQIGQAFAIIGGLYVFWAAMIIPRSVLWIVNR